MRLVVCLMLAILGLSAVTAEAAQRSRLVKREVIRERGSVHHGSRELLRANSSCHSGGRELIRERSVIRGGRDVERLRIRSSGHPARVEKVIIRENSTPYRVEELRTQEFRAY